MGSGVKTSLLVGFTLASVCCWVTGYLPKSDSRYRGWSYQHNFCDGTSVGIRNFNGRLLVWRWLYTKKIQGWQALPARPGPFGFIDSDNACFLEGYIGIPWHTHRFRSSYRRAVAAWFPIWLPTATFVVPTVLLLTRKRRRGRRQQIGLCAQCGYDLQGNVSNRCPECGLRCIGPISTK